jgi:hypothetical protein
VIADRVDAFGRAVAAAFPPGAAVSVAAATLPRRGALVRCLAPAAPLLLDAIDRVWATARREVLALPPLALRKP